MKRHLHFIFLPFLLVFQMCMAFFPWISWASTSITFEKSIHVTTAEGSDVVLEAGSYLVEPTEEWLRVIPNGGKTVDALLLETHVGHHDETLDTTLALSAEGESAGSWHVILLLPTGEKYESVGTISGIRSRGSTPFTLGSVRLKTLVQQAQTSLPQFQGQISSSISPESTSALSDTNPCIRDVRGEFLKVRTHGDKLGFHHTQTPGAYSQAGHSHYQGIQRFGKYLAVSGSASQAGEILIIEMASRPAADRFRSNRLSSNTPPTNDRVIKVVEASRTLTHAGGFQVVGDVLVVGMEGGNVSEVVFYNIKNPKNPQELYRIPRSGAIGGFSEKPSAGATALVKRPDGRFVLIVGRSDSNVLDIYLSQAVNLLTNTFQYVDSWHERELQGMDREFGNYQNINLIRQCDGQLFFVGLHKNVKLGGVIRGGEDWADLFKLELLQLSQTGNPGVMSHHTVITKVANRHIYCHDICDFDAGAGVYIDTNGELFIYGVEHWRHSGVVRLNEFRPVPTSISPPLTNPNQAWVELYDDHSFGDRSIIADFVDQSLRNYSDYDRVEGFEDKTSSVKWAIPSGWQYLLFEDKNFKGRMLKLNGTGNLGVISNLGSSGWNDKVSSSRYSPATITQLNQAWVELFDDNTFKDRRLTVDGSSTGIGNYKNITVEGQRGFGDKVSSARYMIPSGYVYRLYEHDSYKGKTLDLVGTGRIEEIADFNSRGFNDKVSSSKFIRR
ncbi:MAG: hypothetical protein AB7T38_06465 [Nitrospirales bacterium]